VRSPLRLVGAALVLLATFACDRAIEPYVPGEKPEQPDLSRIFPEGAERATKEGPVSGPGAGMSAAAARSDGSTPPPAASDAQPVSGTVALADGFDHKVPAGAILFIVARNAQAAGPPLAVKRIESPHFPLDFSLGPDDRMIKQLPFVGPLQLSARLDADGNAMTRAPGDLQGQAAGTHQPGESGVAIVIDQVL
jgi:cytochrome c-type biogenesis protein CcmH